MLLCQVFSDSRTVDTVVFSCRIVLQTFSCCSRAPVNETYALLLLCQVFSDRRTVDTVVFSCRIVLQTFSCCSRTPVKKQNLVSFVRMTLEAAMSRYAKPWRRETRRSPLHLMCFCQNDFGRRLWAASNINKSECGHTAFSSGLKFLKKISCASVIFSIGWYKSWHPKSYTGNTEYKFTGNLKFILSM